MIVSKHFFVLKTVGRSQTKQTTIADIQVLDKKHTVDKDIYLQVAGGRWQVAGGRWAVAGGRWQVAVSRWKVAVRRWKVACGPPVWGPIGHQLVVGGILT